MYVVLAGSRFRFEKASIRHSPFRRGKHFSFFNYVCSWRIRAIRRNFCDIEQDKDPEDPLVAIDHRSSFAERVI